MFGLLHFLQSLLVSIINIVFFTLLSIPGAYFFGALFLALVAAVCVVLVLIERFTGHRVQEPQWLKDAFAHPLPSPPPTRRPAVEQAERPQPRTPSPCRARVPTPPRYVPSPRSIHAAKIIASWGPPSWCVPMEIPKNAPQSPSTESCQSDSVFWPIMKDDPMSKRIQGPDGHWRWVTATPEEQEARRAFPEASESLGGPVDTGLEDASSDVASTAVDTAAPAQEAAHAPPPATPLRPLTPLPAMETTAEDVSSLDVPVAEIVEEAPVSVSPLPPTPQPAMQATLEDVTDTDVFIDVPLDAPMADIIDEVPGCLPPPPPPAPTPAPARLDFFGQFRKYCAGVVPADDVARLLDIGMRLGLEVARVQQAADDAFAHLRAFAVAEATRVHQEMVVAEQRQAAEQAMMARRAAQEQRCVEEEERRAQEASRLAAQEQQRRADEEQRRAEEEQRRNLEDVRLKIAFHAGQARVAEEQRRAEEARQQAETQRLLAVEAKQRADYEDRREATTARLEERMLRLAAEEQAKEAERFAASGVVRPRARAVKKRTQALAEKKRADAAAEKAKSEDDKLVKEQLDVLSSFATPSAAATALNAALTTDEDAAADAAEMTRRSDEAAAAAQRAAVVENVAMIEESAGIKGPKAEDYDETYMRYVAYGAYDMVPERVADANQTGN